MSVVFRSGLRIRFYRLLVKIKSNKSKRTKFVLVQMNINELISLLFISIWTFLIRVEYQKFKGFIRPQSDFFLLNFIGYYHFYKNYMDNWFNIWCFFDNIFRKILLFCKMYEIQIYDCSSKKWKTSKMFTQKERNQTTWIN